MIRQIAIPLALAAVLVGCSSTTTPQSNSGKTSDEAGTGSAAPESVMVVVINTGTPDDYETESIKSFPNPTAAQIEEQVRAQDWTNPTRRPNVGVSRTTAKTLDRVRLHGVIGSTDPNLAFRAEWAGEDGDQEFDRRSPPLESLDAAIRILQAYQSKDPGLQTLTEWTDKPSE